MAADVFHRAARDGYLDLLREATRRDVNRQDEDGMTPTLWAAFDGNLDALRMVVIRGGNPDVCDLLGNSALHHAAANNHMHCVTFLVSFGANLWCLDNEYHTALDISALHGHTEIMKYLDNVASKQAFRNRKVVTKLKEKAAHEARKRIKKYEKIQAKTQKKAEKTDKVFQIAQKQNEARARIETGTASHSAPASAYSTMKSDSWLSRLSVSTQRTTQSEPLPYSVLTISSGKKRLGGVARKMRQRSSKSFKSTNNFNVIEREMDGRQTIRSLTGLQRDAQIMYMKNKTDTISSGSNRSTSMEDYGYSNRADDTISRAISEPDFMALNDDSGIESGEIPDGVSIFERPGFGSVSFMNRRMTSGTLRALHSEGESSEEAVDSAVSSPIHSDEGNGRSKQSSQRRQRRRGSFTDSIGTVGSLAARMRDLPWEEDDLDNLDDDELVDSSPLEMFLVANNLNEFISTFTQEKIDLMTMMLLTDQDLKDLDIPLGPRRKLLHAISVRKETLKTPGIIMDTRL